MPVAFPDPQIVAQFPLLTAPQKPFAYLDNAATTQKPETVIRAVEQFYRTSNSNVHRGVYPLSETSTALYESTRKLAARFVNAESSEIIFTSGATASLNQLAMSLEDNFGPSDCLLLTEAEHHSNLLPWLRLAERRKCRIEWIPVFENGLLDLSTAEAILKKGDVKLVTFASVSHVLGNRQPVEDLLRLAHAHNVWSVIDATQSIAREKTDVRKLGCDALVFSSHKIYGPTGVGVLFANRKLQEKMTPVFVGGGMVDRFSKEGTTTWRAGPWKFEAGTPAIEGVIGFGAALDFVEKEALFSLTPHERILIEKFAHVLAEFPNVQRLGWAADLNQIQPHEGILSFTIEDLHPHDIAQTLSDNGVAVRAGHHCAQLLTDKIAPQGCVRLSLAAYNGEHDLEIFKSALLKCLELRDELVTSVGTT